MQRTRIVLAAVCMFAAAFGGGAVTYSQLTDTETVTVSAAAGEFDLCKAGDTVTYEFSKDSDELENVNGPDIVTFSNYDYRRGFFGPVAVDAVDFEATEPIRAIEYHLRYGGIEKAEYRLPVTQGRLDPPRWFSGPFVAVTFTCAKDDGDATNSVSAANSISVNSSNASPAVVESSEASGTLTEASTPVAENGTKTSTITPSATTKATPVIETTENTSGMSTTTTETQHP